jgi:hypothetical protein
MYAALCSGGFPVPEKEGILRIWSVKAAPLVVGSTIEVKLRDDWGFALDEVDTDKNVVVHLKGDGTSDVEVKFNTPLIVRKGIRATTLTNVDNCLVYIA